MKVQLRTCARCKLVKYVSMYKKRGRGYDTICKMCRETELRKAAEPQKGTAT
jgi:hypothetical protein